MMNQEFKSAGGFKVRAIEAEASGGLVEIDLRAFKVTPDGTYLVPSKDLQGAGRWAFTLDVSQAKKEGKPVSPEDEKKVDQTAFALNEFMQKLPAIIASIKEIKNARVHPVEKGLEAAIVKVVTEIVERKLGSDQEMSEALEEIVEDALKQTIFPDEQQK